MPNFLPVRAFRSWMLVIRAAIFHFDGLSLLLNHRLPGTLALAFRNTQFCDTPVSATVERIPNEPFLNNSSALAPSSLSLFFSPLLMPNLLATIFF